MYALRRRGPLSSRRTIGILLSTLALLAVIGATFSRPVAAATGTHVVLAPAAGAPSASGKADVQVGVGALGGSAKVEDLPAQPFGSGRFYGLWFVRTDTGDKAFLGALAKNDSIIFSHAGDGEIRFAGRSSRQDPTLARGSPSDPREPTCLSC